MRVLTRQAWHTTASPRTARWRNIKNSLSTDFTRSLVWVDRSGSEEVAGDRTEQLRVPENFAWTASASRWTTEMRARDLWVWDILRETRTRLSIDEQGGVYPVWDARRFPYRLFD